MIFDKSHVACGAVLGVVTFLLVFAMACGGGHSSASTSGSGAGSGSGGGVPAALSTTCGSSASNCVPLTADNGLNNGYVDGAFTTVTVCEPLPSNSCVKVDGVLVDTGSVGLRLLKSAVSSSITLPPSKAASLNSLVECFPFVASFMWGPVAIADILIGGETASNAPIMLIDDSTTPQFTAPTTCSGSGSASLPPLNTLAELRANGILGIGNTQQDCGELCTSNVNNGRYYDCANASNCVETTASLDSQVPNPVSRFAKDNNGTAISLPSVPVAGAPSLAGALYFGIGTQTNNTMPGTTAVLTLNPTFLSITTIYKGASNPDSFFDSGSNGYFFPDSTIPACSPTQPDPSANDWFCPANELALSATNAGGAGSSGTSTVSFNVANRDALTKSPNIAFDNLGGPGVANSFDWGLPFFFGRVVYTAIELKPVTDTGGTTFTGPFVAY